MSLRTFILTLFVLSPLLVLGQGRNNKNPNFCPGAKNYVGVWAAPYIEIGLPEQFTGTQLGFGAGALFRDHIYVGGYASGLISQDFETTLDAPPNDGEPLDYGLRLSSFGGWFTFSPIGADRVRLLLGTRLGFTRVHWRNIDADVDYRSGSFVATPTVSIEFPLSYYARFSLGAGYRIAGELALPEGFPGLSSPFIQANVRLGQF